ncbi:CRP-like protein Clp [Stenotrophomonas maltophilia]|nr:CRP-like protein Clp [Stenotrophomonas maltophilia]
MSTVRLASSPLALDIATIDRFLAHSHRRRYPTRTDVFRPGDPAGTLYYVISGSVSIMAEEDDDRELVLGYFGAGEFVGEMGLFVESDRREVILRTRTACELAEISYERLHQLFLGPLSADAPRLLYALGQQISKRLLDTSRKASRLAFLDVTDRIVRTLHDLAQEPEAMSHPQGSQLRVSRQELARLVGCSREMAGRVLKKLQTDGLLQCTWQDRGAVRHPLIVEHSPGMARRYPGSPATVAPGHARRIAGHATYHRMPRTPASARLGAWN